MAGGRFGSRVEHVMWCSAAMEPRPDGRGKPANAALMAHALSGCRNGAPA